MIGQLPKIYEDELIYSWLTRYIVYSGILYRKTAYQEIYNKNVYIPNFKFIYGIKKEILDEMEKHMTLEEIIYNHTMFPEYTIFAIDETKNELVDLMINDYNEFGKRIHHFDHQLQYLRYCPLCVKEDKDKYGETYWHRIHQLKDILICPNHFCYLYNVETEKNYRNSVKKFYIANESVYQEEVKYETNFYIKALAKYVKKIFLSKNIKNIERFSWESGKMYPFSKACNIHVHNIGTTHKNKNNYLRKFSGTKYYIRQNAKKIINEYNILKIENNLSWNNLLIKTGLKKIQFKNALPILAECLSKEDVNTIKKYLK